MPPVIKKDSDRCHNSPPPPYSIVMQQQPAREPIQIQQPHLEPQLEGGWTHVPPMNMVRQQQFQQMPSPPSTMNTTSSQSKSRGFGGPMDGGASLEVLSVQYPMIMAPQHEEIQAMYSATPSVRTDTTMEMLSPQHSVINSPPSHLVQQQQSQQMLSGSYPTNLQPSSEKEDAEKSRKTRKTSSKRVSQDLQAHDNPNLAQETSSVQRFFGDTMIGRVARSSIQTAASTMRMSNTLSPWGDNNPVTLPNIRYRDAVLFTTFELAGAPLTDAISDSISSTFGAEHLLSEIVSSTASAIATSPAVKFPVFQTAEQAIDRTILDPLTPDELKILQTPGTTTLQISIRHNLMGVNADLTFISPSPSPDPNACAKAWFAPYLFATARTPLIPRATHFSVCEFRGPALAADYALAPKLLSHSPTILALCDPSSPSSSSSRPSITTTHNNPPAQQQPRMAIFFTAISPSHDGSPKKEKTWSSSRRPGVGTLSFHLFHSCPALVVPVSQRAPVLAWSAYTLEQILSSSPSSSSLPVSSSSTGTDTRTAAQRYPIEVLHKQLCGYLLGEAGVDPSGVYPAVGASGGWRAVLERFVWVLVCAVARVGGNDVVVRDEIDPARAGIVMFRF
ncbi:unnamed protein product [Periconia digitata]|uniref:Uncharacterized protein n=1 Tax=Periconia digitata TaxID=1303443 RepID=A0A9W4UW41_9PLEO|nr:unnamed protein product [Periconia digitata]